MNTHMVNATTALQDSQHKQKAEISLLEMEEDHEIAVYSKRNVVIVRGKGALVWDEKGREYIDCVAGHGSANLGHCHPAVVAAIKQQVDTLITCPEVFHNDKRALVLERLSMVSGFPRTFLSNSGTESVEAAIKFARATTRRANILAFMQGFHGRSMGALSATWKKEYREPFLPLIPGFSHLPYNKTDQLTTKITTETAAVLVEIVQGEGGVRPAEREFLQALRLQCDKTGTLLVFDEVQTGVGRTGTFFAFEQYGVRPDIVCIAKSLAGGIPIGATLCSSAIEIPKSSHGSTFGGNPVSCAAALAVLDVFEKTNLLAEVREKGEYLMKKLSSIKSPLIREVRGRGLMIAIELKDKSAPFLQSLLDEGVLALPAGPMVVRLLPPLVITREQMDRVVAALEKVLADAAQGGAAKRSEVKDGC